MEVCSLRDAAKDLAKLRVQVFGISCDNIAKQKTFWKKQKLNFDLLSDPKGDVAKRYGVLYKGRTFSKRVTFVIDPKGVIRLIETKVKVRSHGKDLVTKIKELQRQKR